jgi:hypothetical protein
MSVLCLAYSSNLKMESLRSTAMLENVSQATRLQILEDTTPRNHWPESPKSNMECDTGSEALTSVVMKSITFWNVTPCGPLKYSWSIMWICLRFIVWPTYRTRGWILHIPTCTGSIIKNSGLQPGVGVTMGVHEFISGDKRKHLTSIKTKHSKLMNIERALILALTKIGPGIEVLASSIILLTCQNHINNW